MTIDVGAVGNTGLYTNSGAPREAKNELDSETFMNLLVAQLKYQDPSSPMSTNDMMAQTTQLASMEQLTKLTVTASENFALGMRDAAANLVGKTVTYIDGDGEIITGEVSSVRYDSMVPTVMVGEVLIPLDSVQAVVRPELKDPVAPDGAAPEEDTPGAVIPDPASATPPSA